VSTTRADAEALDAADPLADFRGRFCIPDDELVYLDGNSLGRPPRVAIERVEALLREGWAGRLIRGWYEGWMALPTRLGDRLGAGLLGAAAGQVVLADSTTVCFYKLAAAALDARPDRDEVVVDRANFPTDRYVVEALAEQRRLRVRWLDPDPSAGDVDDAVGPRTALVTLSHVAYSSGRRLDLAAITRVAHGAGALVLWDLCHSAGVLPVMLDDADVDLAVGCTYKFLNGGPGAPAFLYVATRHQATLRQPIWGWFGARDPFAMGPEYVPAEGIDRMISGTPPVIGLTAASAGIELAAEVGVERLEAKAAALTALAIELADERLARHGVRVGTPRDPRERGAHVALCHPRARELRDALDRRGVIVDMREPDVLRFGLSPLTTRFTDVWDGVAALDEILSE
jgi:kynureninase